MIVNSLNRILSVMKVICIMSILSISSEVKAQESHDALKAKADSLWKTFEFKPPGLAEMIESRNISREVRYAKLERRNRNFREKGLIFWFLFPNDPRRFKWLSQTISPGSFTFYWKDIDKASREVTANGIDTFIEVDKEVVVTWNLLYPYLRKEFFNSSLISDSAKNIFRCNELSWITSTQSNPASRFNRKLDFMSFAKLYKEYSDSYWQKWNDNHRNPYENPISNVNMLLQSRTTFGLDYNDLQLMIHYLDQSSDSKEIKEWTNSAKAYLKLLSEPFNLNHPTINGKSLSLNDLRGKVVLIDFWATWCGSCIEAMPGLKKLYDKYKARGFEVISVSLDTEENRKEVLNVMDKVGAEWSTMIIGGKAKTDRASSLGSKIWNTYSFSAIPVILVLNKSGLLVGDYGDLRNREEFEKKLEKWLDEPYQSKNN